MLSYIVAGDRRHSRRSSFCHRFEFEIFIYILAHRRCRLAHTFVVAGFPPETFSSVSGTSVQTFRQYIPACYFTFFAVCNFQCAFVSLTWIFSHRFPVCSFLFILLTYICINISFLFLSYNFGKRRNIEGEIIRMGDGDCGGGALAHLYSCALHGIKMTRAIS